MKVIRPRAHTIVISSIVIGTTIITTIITIVTTITIVSIITISVRVITISKILCVCA